jgi:hypothetical protein
MAFDYASKVRALLAMAGDEALSEEARQAYQDKAYALMRDYQVAEEEAIAVDITAAVPITTVVDLKVGYEFGHIHGAMIREIARHTGIRVHVAYINIDGDRGLRATLVGYEGDIRYAEFLWTNAHLMFATKVNPQYDATLSEAENVYRLRSSGMKRADIADLVYGRGEGANASARSKVQRIYTREVAKRGEKAIASGLGFNYKLFREGYAEEFVATLTRRLMMARDAADTAGGGLVLHGRKDRVDEAFYIVFPAMRPDTTPAVPYVDPAANCPNCAKAKTTCRQHPTYRWTKADEARENARRYGASAQAGRGAGQAAAEGVVIRGTAARTDRVESGQRALEN